MVYLQTVDIRREASGLYCATHTLSTLVFPPSNDNKRIREDVFLSTELKGDEGGSYSRSRMHAKVPLTGLEIDKKTERRLSACRALEARTD